MNQATLQPVTSRPPVVIAALTLLAVLGFAGVTRLVNRFVQQQKALARHLYQQGLNEQQAGKFPLALEHFREALTYDHDNSQYQLSLARALRDSGRTDEAETHLISLWERTPQDGAVNLALGRLAAREKLLDKTMQYYHSAIYGVWTSNPDENRLNAWFELIDFLIRQNARPQAEAELITISAELPPRPDLGLRVADLFARVEDYDHALAEYRRVLDAERANLRALAGAGDAAFHLGRYRTAVHYLEEASGIDSHNDQTNQMLQVSKLVLSRDPFLRGISSVERERRLRQIFNDAGKRLDDCMNTRASISPAPQLNALPALKAEWTQMKPELAGSRQQNSLGFPYALMDLVLRIEQQTAVCGSDAEDQALMLLAENRSEVEQ